jgi:hypothetical protein
MKVVYALFVLMNMMTLGLFAQREEQAVPSFQKIIVSPHIELTLIQGDHESVTIENAKLPKEKINMVVEGNTLHLYLDGAKMVTKAERVSIDQWRGKQPIYQGTMATLTVTYKTLEHLSVRGEEVVRCKSPLKQDAFKLTVYGEAKVYFQTVDLNQLVVAIYGESYFKIENGAVNRQVYRAYGESEVNTEAIDNRETKITAYGESNFRVNVQDRLKVTCYGETTVAYKGGAQVDRGIVIGEAEIVKIG